MAKEANERLLAEVAWLKKSAEGNKKALVAAKEVVETSRLA